MANFTSTELEAAVSRYVRSTVKTERTALGPLDVRYSFDEVREFVASTLVFDPSSVFYLLSLAANRVNQDQAQATSYLTDIITGIGEVGRDTTVVTQTSLLEDAAAALLDVERTIRDNSAIAAKPFSRYSQALDSFTAKSLTPNVRRSGSGFPDVYEIVRPPQQAQTAIRAAVAELRDLHVALLAEVRQLAAAFSEFMAANLPLIAIQRSIPLVRQDLRTLKGSFDKATRDGAIEQTRDAFLALQAGKAVVTNLTSISDPSEARMSSTGTSADRAAAASPSATATPAQVLTTLSAPYFVTPTSNELRLELNGGPEQIFTLSVPDPAFVLGSVDEPYDIHGASAAVLNASFVGPYTVPAAPDNLFSLYVDGVGYGVTLTAGSRTAAQLAAEINVAPRLDGLSGLLGSVATASDAAGGLQIEHDTVGAHTLALGSQPTLNTALGFTDGQQAAGEAANNALRFVVQDGTVVEVPLTIGSAQSAGDVAADLAISSFLNASAEVVTTDSGSITVVKVSSASYGEDSHIRVQSTTGAQQEAVKTLGFYENQEDRGDYLLLTDLVRDLSALTGAELVPQYAVLHSGSDGTAAVVAGIPKLLVPAGTLVTLPTTSDRLRILNGANVGWYAIAGVSLGGLFDELLLGRPWPSAVGDEALGLSWEIRRDLLLIASADTSTASAVTVNAASANAILGLTAGTLRGKVSGVRVLSGSKPLNFTREDVVAGDRLTLKGPTYSTVHTIASVTEGGYQLEVTPEVPNDLVQHLYQIDGSGALAYAAFIVALDDWTENVLGVSKFTSSIQELERVLNPLLVNKNPSAALIGSATTVSNDLLGVYTELKLLLSGFVTLPVPRIDALLDMLLERGLDRAHELLLLGRFSEFFGLSQDAASYGGNLLEKMRSLAQNDVPLGRSSRFGNVEQRLTGSYEETDADLDFSDQDDERGPTAIDDVPDLDADEDFLNKAL